MNITTDVVAVQSPIPPFYSSVVHVRLQNPVPQTVRVKTLRLLAMHMNLSGPVLYNLTRELDTSRYVLPPSEGVTLDFELNVLSEVNWGFLFSARHILELLAEAAKRNVTVGVQLNLALEIDDGYEQEVHYKNHALSSVLCFHPFSVATVCGGIPPMPDPPLSQLLLGSGHKLDERQGGADLVAFAHGVKGQTNQMPSSSSGDIQKQIQMVV